MPEHRMWSTPGVYVNEVDSPRAGIVGVPTSVTAFLGRTGEGPVGQPRRVTSLAEHQETFGRQQSTVAAAVRDYFANGGEVAVVVRTEDGAAGVTTSAHVSAALGALEEAGPVNLLVIPPYTADGDVDREVVTAAAAYCEEHRCILLLDPPSAWRTAEDASLALAARDPIALLGTASANAALYFPRVRREAREPGDGSATVGPSAAVAGVIARTDRERGVWKAPAGSDSVLAGVRATASTVDDEHLALLTSYGVNCLRELPGRGTAIWGARTLQGGSASGTEWRYLPVRRTALFLEASLEEGTRWVVFEPNNEPLWASVRTVVEQFLEEVWRRGGLAGGTADEAFFVRCGRDTMTQSDLDAGRLIIEVGFAPVKPAEFVILRISHTMADADG